MTPKVLGRQVFVDGVWRLEFREFFVISILAPKTTILRLKADTSGTTISSFQYDNLARTRCPTMSDVIRRHISVNSNVQALSYFQFLV
jgi:hypothetical protein